VLSLGVLCWSLVAWLELAAGAFEGVFLPLLVLKVVAKVGFCVPLVAASRCG
jgi:hypothetical protein